MKFLFRNQTSDEAYRRLKEAAKSYKSNKGIVKVSAFRFKDYVILTPKVRYQNSFLYSFYGRLRDDETGTQVTGGFATHPMVTILLGFVLLFFSIVSFVTMGASGGFYIFFNLIGMFAFVFVICRWIAKNEDRRVITEILQEQAEAIDKM